MGLPRGYTAKFAKSKHRVSEHARCTQLGNGMCVPQIIRILDDLPRPEASICLSGKEGTAPDLQAAERVRLPPETDDVTARPTESVGQEFYRVLATTVCPSNLADLNSVPAGDYAGRVAKYSECWHKSISSTPVHPSEAKHGPRNLDWTTSTSSDVVQQFWGLSSNCPWGPWVVSAEKPPQGEPRIACSG